MQLRPGGMPVECIRVYTYQILDVLWFLHGKSVVHKNLKVFHCFSSLCHFCPRAVRKTSKIVQFFTNFDDRRIVCILRLGG
jgi:hypothetical protein